jgi:RNA polymerase sigma-70 factor (ECF subfamily)
MDAVAEVTRANPAVLEARLRRMAKAHVDALWRFMRRLGVLETDIDDVMQEVILIAARRLDEIPPESEKAFLFATAFRMASKERRRRARRQEVADDALFEHVDPAPGPEQASERASERATLDAVLAGMPLDMRAVFVLYEIEEHTMIEIAVLLDLAPGTVASRLRRARDWFEARVARMRGGGT